MGTYTGTDGDDTIEPGFISGGVVADPLGTTPGAGDDSVYGGAGNDVLRSAGGNDTLYGGSDLNNLYGGSGNDLIYGYDSASFSNFFGDAGNDLLNGGENDDHLYGGAGDDLLIGRAGNDSLYAGDFGPDHGGVDQLFGGAGDDALGGGEGGDRVFGGAGNDSLSAYDGSVLFGGEGDDRLYGGFDLTMKGGAGNDAYWVDDHKARVIENFPIGEGGKDHVFVFSNTSFTLGFGLENLTLKKYRADIDGTGNALDNMLRGNSGSNVLRGVGGDDRLHGQLGADELAGGKGNDMLRGGRDTDWLGGGEGNDAFMFDRLEDGGDTIADFHNQSGNDDRIVISVSGFGGSMEAGGHLSRDQFQTSENHQARDAEVRFIFDTSGKTLWFDGNGSEAGGLWLIADLQADADLTHHDIFLI